MRRSQIPATRNLTDRQKFLLNSLPGPYSSNLPPFIEPREPKDVKAARKLVNRWEHKIRVQKCRHDKRNQALLQKGRESVYFDSEKKALQIVRQVNKLLDRPCAPGFAEE